MEYGLLFLITIYVTLVLYLQVKAYNYLVGNVNKMGSVLVSEVENKLSDLKVIVKDVLYKVDECNLTPRMRQDINEIKNELERVSQEHSKKIDTIMIDIDDIKTELPGFHAME